VNAPATLDVDVLQFGTGKFLRAFVDLMLHQQNARGNAPRYVAAVQTTGAERAAALAARDGRFHVAVRGIAEGRRVDRVEEVQSIRRALSAASQWPEILAVACGETLRTIVSNTTEAGYRLCDEDRPDDAPPRSFPAKLLLVLQARYAAGLPGATILPCELLPANGETLRDRVVGQAGRWNLAKDLVDWLVGRCRWCNTLVDRIVGSLPADDPLTAEDPLACVTEPFALWLVEGREPVDGLLSHPSVQCVDRLEPYQIRKVRILNGAHTALVAKAMPAGFRTVREAIEDPSIRRWLRRLLFDEIVPVLEGRTEQPEAFARQVLGRFANPWIEHRLADIALAHEAKLAARLAPTLAEYRARFGRMPPLLSELLGTAQGGA
jgi:tagaturonate reductase